MSEITIASVTIIAISNNPDVISSCILYPELPPTPPSSGIGTWTPIAPGISDEDLPVTPDIIDTSPTQIIGCINEAGDNSQQRLNELFPDATAGDGVLDKATYEYWIYNGTTWSNVGSNPGLVITYDYLVPMYLRKAPIKCLTKTLIVISDFPYSLELSTNIEIATTTKARTVLARIIQTTETIVFNCQAIPPIITIGLPVAFVQLTAHNPLIAYGFNIAIPSINASINTLPCNISHGIIIAPDTTSLTILTTNPLIATTVIDIPITVIHINITSCIVSGGASVKAPTTELAVNFVMPTVLAYNFTSGLMVHLDPGSLASYPGAGTTLTDITGGNNGTIVSPSAYSSSNSGTVSVVSTGRISVANAGSYLSNVSSFSVCLFVSLPSGTANNGIFSYGSSANYANDIFLALSSNTLFAQVNSGTDGSWSYARPAAGWCMLTMVYNGTESAANRLKVYRNESLLTPSSSSYAIPAATPNVSGNTWIGTYATSGTGDWPLNGSVGPFLLYNQSIDASKISKIFNNYRSRYSL